MLVAHVDPGTPAASAGIDVGDVILDVHGRSIAAAPDVLSALSDLGKGEHVTNMAWSPPWLRDWSKPPDQPRRNMDSPQTSKWLDKLRELFAPKSGSACQRS